VAPKRTLVERYTGLPINALAQQLDLSRLGGPLSQLQSGIQSLGRAASAAMDPGEAWLQEGERQARNRPERQGPTRDIYEQPGVGFFDRQSGRFLGKAPAAPVLPGAAPAPGMGVTPVVRHEDDQYRQLLSQYGALSKAGKQEEAEKLGMEIWQKKYGKTPMAQPGGAVGSFNPLMQSTFGYQRGQQAPEGATYAGQPAETGLGTDFSLAANAVPAPWNEQGAKVSADFAGVVPLQAAKTSGEGMPAFQTTGEKATQLLSDPRFSRFLQK
jgi:hypothetical protein